jgi:hypothetical protein
MTGNTDLIIKVIQDLKKEQESIETQLIDICYNMNGGVTWGDVWSIPAYLREKMIKYINKKIQQMNGNNKEYM